MQRLMGITAVGLSLVLLMPLGVAAQEGPEGVLEASDPIGDAIAIAGPMQIEAVTANEPAPAHLDMTMLRLAVEDEDLVVTIEVAGDIPEQDPNLGEAMFTLMIWYGGDDTFRVETRQSEDWRVSLSRSRRVPDEPARTVSSSTHGYAVLSGNRLTMRVPLERLGGLDEARLLAYTSGVRDCTPTDPCDVVGADVDASNVPFVWWADAVPDDLLGDEPQGLTWHPAASERYGQSTGVPSTRPTPDLTD